MKLTYYVEVTSRVFPFNHDRTSFVSGARATQQILRYWFESASDAEDGATQLRRVHESAEVSITCPARPAEVE